MRLWKKVSAMVAMAAMCMTLAVPVTASAAEVDARMGACPEGCNWLPGLEKVLIDSETHKHNGKYDCTINYKRIYYFNYCEGCGSKQIYAHEDYEEHVRI